MTKENYCKNYEHQCYCEAIILPDGTIEDAIPSHLHKMAKIYGKPLNYFYDLMPVSAAPISWLADYTNCCCIWYEFCIVPETVNEKQLETIKYLQEQKIVNENYHIEKSRELSLCGIVKKEENER